MTATGSAPEQVIEDFEKKLIGSPNSSFIWIKYISAAIHLIDLSKARSIAERALQTINFREEQEKMNVWVAYMNLEYLYGTLETFKKVFERSITYCDVRSMYMQLAKLYSNNGKHKEAEETFQIISKKFGQSCKVWITFGEYLYEQQDFTRGRKLLTQALCSLPRRKHEKATVKFAQLEYRYASIERGRTLFEGVLANSPKRTDLWSIYVTMEENLCKREMGKENSEFLRRLFERIVHMKLSSKKAKYFFKRYLEFEKTFGTNLTVNHVKELARQYVENSMNK